MKIILLNLSRFAESKRLTIWLIVILIILTLVGNIVPQAPLPSADSPAAENFSLITLRIVDFLKLNNVFYAYPFFMVLTLLFFNLTFCMFGRGKAVFEDSVTAGRFFRTSAGLKFIGSIIFHISLLLIMTGALYDAATRMRGGLVITQGQMVDESHESYVGIDEAPFFLENHSFFKIELKDVDFKFDKGVMLDSNAVLGITDGDFSGDFVIKVNQPLLYKGTMFVMQQYGFAPLLKLTDAEGKQVVNAYLNLAAPEMGGTVEDSFHLPQTDMELTIKLFPDAEIEDGMIRTLSQELHAPKLIVQLDRLIEDGKIKELLHKGAIEPGENVTFQGYTLHIGDIRYWVQFDVLKEPGKKIVYTGFWLGLAGLSVRLFLIFMKPVNDNELVEKNEI